MTTAYFLVAVQELIEHHNGSCKPSGGLFVKIHPKYKK